MVMLMRHNLCTMKQFPSPESTTYHRAAAAIRDLGLKLKHDLSRRHDTVRRDSLRSGPSFLFLFYRSTLFSSGSGRSNVIVVCYQLSHVLRLSLQRRWQVTKGLARCLAVEPRDTDPHKSRAVSRAADFLASAHTRFVMDCTRYMNFNYFLYFFNKKVCAGAAEQKHICTQLQKQRRR
jgi:hypothetical protein